MMDRKVESLVSYIIRSRNRGRTMKKLISKFPGADVPSLIRAAREAGYEVYYENLYEDGWTLLFLCHDQDPVRKEG